MKIYQTELVLQGESKLDQHLQAVLSEILSCDVVVHWLTAQISREALAELLFAAGQRKPVAVVFGAQFGADAASLLAASFGCHQLGHTPSATKDQMLNLVEKCVEHADRAIGLVGGCADVIECLARAESPIEERMAVHLCAAFDGTCRVIPQSELQIEGKTFRADFLLLEPETGARMVVEVDGHDFHERTKEQAKRDRSRDRAMLASGLPVMRFTGSEVWNEPRRCAREVHEYLSRLLEKRMGGEP